MTRKIVQCVLSGIVVFFALAAGDSSAQDEVHKLIEKSIGIPFPVPPGDNPITTAKVELGRDLFFNKILSRDNSISCATCHDPNYGFSDPHRVSIGTKGAGGQRNSMSILNSHATTALMWDGRAASLEDQALMPFASPEEFDVPVEKAVQKLRIQGYEKRFEAVFGTGITPENLARALAAYERTLTSGNSPFDRFLFMSDETAISPAAKRGFAVFLRVKCDSCHLIMTPGLHPFKLKWVLFTDNKFHNLGVGTDQEHPDPGRFGVTGDAHDWAAFRTPSLRNVELTAPYFHDGSMPSLEEVIDFYDRGGTPNRNLDPAIVPLHLSNEDKSDLAAFLRSLTSAPVTASSVAKSGSGR